jgi:hypothetical protein
MKEKMMDDVENVGIMQGFLDMARQEDDDLEEEEDSEEGTSARMLNRSPDSPEILMNNLRGDMRSVDARREELADLVGYKAAADTPDSVLAMLQPVLAQGAGLGALPQSGPVAQGPQAPMPPPPGGSMGMPPQAAPPAPSGGDMAALLAAATPAPGGGMAPGAMVGPDGRPIPQEGVPPIQMRDGGFVQRFRDGSEEEGVTQLNEMPSSSYAALLESLGPSVEVPSTEDAMKRRMELYEKIGAVPSQESAKANILFDIAGAALGYASNRGPSGEALTGSGLSRFAGAFSALPAAIQKRAMDIQDTRRQLSLIALEGAEKDRQSAMEMNQQLAEESRRIALAAINAEAANARTERTAQSRELAATIRAGGTRIGGGGPYGKGNESLNIFINLAELYGSGQTTPEQDRVFETAVRDYTQPKIVPVIDPVSKLATGEYTTGPGDILPDYVQQAIQRRAGTQTGATPSSAAPTEPAPLTAQEQEAQRPISLWRDRYLIAGPGTTAAALASRIPGLGDPFQDITIARQQARQITEDFVSAFTKSKADAVSEQRLIRSIVGIEPTIGDPEVYGSNLIAVSNFLDKALQENRQKADTTENGVGRTLAPAAVSAAREKVQLLEGLRESLGLPVAVYSKDELNAIPPNTEVLWQGKEPTIWRGRP